MEESPQRRSIYPIVAGAGLTLLFHAASWPGYGYFRDELYYLDCASQLDWGYVDHPPFSIAALRVLTRLLGDSVWVLRPSAALLGAISVGLSVQFAANLGGSMVAQVIVATTLALAPGILGVCGFYSMNAWDLLFWALAFLWLARALDGRKNAWYAFGLCCGLGLQNKFSFLFLAAALGAGLLLSGRYRLFVTKELWLGAALAMLVFLPHMLWQIAYGFPTLEFMRNAALHKNMPFDPLGFLSAQAMFAAGAFPFLIGGLVLPFLSRELRTFRVFAVVGICLLGLYIIGGGKPYYFLTSYLFLIPVGAISLERLVPKCMPYVTRVVIPAIVLLGALFAPYGIPLLPVEAFLRYQDMLGLAPPQQERAEQGPLPQHFADCFGWPEMVQKISEVYHSLPEAEQRQAAIFCGNYGQAAAVNFFGKAEGLPRGISTHNNYFFWGYPENVGSVVIFYGFRDVASLRDLFMSVEKAAEFDHPLAMPYERHVPIYVCRNLRVPMAALWPQLKAFI